MAKIKRRAVDEDDLAAKVAASIESNWLADDWPGPDLDLLEVSLDLDMDLVVKVQAGGSGCQQRISRADAEQPEAFDALAASLATGFEI